MLASSNIDEKHAVMYILLNALWDKTNVCMLAVKMELLIAEYDLIANLWRKHFHILVYL
jgi:hypothetical protein